MSLRTLPLLLVLAACPRPGTTPDASTPVPAGHVRIGAETVPVSWSDGDTFKIKSGSMAGKNARLSGFNTLEDYGPVHRWGGWTREELYALAKAPEAMLSSRGWTCEPTGKEDKYERLLLDCPEVAETLISEGLAMVFTVQGEPDARLVKAQHSAQDAGKGMWLKGLPPQIVTSLHSVDEGRGYNRIVDSARGTSKVRAHEERYETCQEVCEGPDGSQSCMLYVPYERRYKNQPECLAGTTNTTEKR